MRWRRVLPWVLVLSLVAPAALWAAAPHIAAPLGIDGAYHVLLLGSDNDPFHGGAGRGRGTDALRGRADAIHLVSLSADHQRVSILSFPRDTWTTVPGIGRTKINAGLTRGPETMVAAVEGVAGVDISDWMVTSFSGLSNALDITGGLEVDVDQRLRDPRGAGTDLHPGRQRLGGWALLGFARDRKSRSNGDFGRSGAQSEILSELHAQFAVGAGPARLAEVVSVLVDHAESSISPPQLLVLASIASRIDPANVTRRVLPGRATTLPGGASVVVLQPEAERLFERLRADTLGLG